MKQHGHHLIFGIGIISLTLLATWWSVFINRSIEERHQSKMENLDLTLALYSEQLGNRDTNPSISEKIKKDKRFEIIPCPQKGEKSTRLKYSRPLRYPYAEQCLKIKDRIIDAIEKDFKRKKIMVTGESGLLFLLIFFSSILLYQFIRLERRSTLEMEEFWGRVTHEIKTPITGIKAFLQNLSNRSIKPEKMLPYVSMALQQIDKQEKLAENILAGYGLRFKNNHHKPDLENLILNDFLNSYFQQHMIHLTDARLIMHLKEGEEIGLKADTHLFRIILDNIVDNALKYCSPGLILQVKVSTLDRRAIISIKDNGPGFPPHVSEKLFEAYRHLKGELPGGKHGSGMGLYISRKLAEKMGGSLEASSLGKGKGAEFKLFLNMSKSLQIPPKSSKSGTTPEELQ